MSTLPPFPLPSNGNTSSSGGPLLPSNIGGDFNDKALKRFLQQLVVTLTGLPGTVVYPRWQKEPPNMPDEGTDWAAIGVVSRERDAFAYEGRAGVNGYSGADTVFRQEVLEVMVSFYGPNSEQYSEIFTMALQVAQNREILTVNNFGLVETQGSITAPALINQRWMEGQDTRFRLRRSLIYTYPVQDVVVANIVLREDVPATSVTIPVNSNTP